MSKNKPIRWLSLVLCLVMIVSLFPISAMAYDPNYQSETHTVFKHTEQTLAPGVDYYSNYAYSSDGKQMVYYVATADISRDDVVVQTSYLNQYKDKQPGMSKLTEQIAFANGYYSDAVNPLYLGDYYNVVAGVNASFYNMQTGQPSGVCFVDGVDFGTDAYPAFFAILKDGTAVMDDRGNKGNYTGEQAIWQAVGGSQWLVRDGADVTASATGDYNTDRHSRTCVGITEDGKVVLMVLDGRQEPFSCGGTMHELAQIMIEAGCKYAMNIDGGGSTTFAARPEGEDAVKIINRPSDGSERSISSGLIIASLAAPSDVFDHVSMSTEDFYVAPGASVPVSVSGVSPAGTTAEIPADLTYVVENGTFSDGVFTAGAVAGDATITAMYNGSPVGSLTIHVVLPEKIEFASENITVPYGATADLQMIAIYGLNQVVTTEANYSFELENPAAATINGMSLTAVDDESITATVITAHFAGTELTATANLLFGKGSEVLFDFEDGSTNGFKTGYAKYNYYLPRGGTSVVTAETGKVHSGNYALAVNIDYSNSQESGYMMNALYRTKSANESAETNLLSANKIGCWIYIPDEYVGLWVRWVLYPISSVDEEGNVTKGGSITSNVLDGGAGGTGVVYSFEESGWHYLSCDFSSYPGAVWSNNLYFMQFYISDRDGTGYGYYAKNAHNINGDFTVYIDDITVDYSTVVDDREPPVFSSVLLGDKGAHSNEAMVLQNGYESSLSELSFSAKVAENTAKNNYTGLDPATAKAYVDGNEVPVTYQDGTMVIDDVDLVDGQHTVKFSICDKQGNYGSIVRTFSVNAGSKAAVKVVPHDPSLDRILFGSLYYVDVVAENVEDVQSVTTTLNLDSMNHWELDHMVVADGFEATYTYEPADKILHLTLTKTGAVSATGEQALVSIPVRVWELNNVGSAIGGSNAVLEEGNQYTYSWFKSQDEYWKVAVEVRVQQGKAVLADGSEQTFTGENVYCDTEAWAIQKFMVETQEGKDYKAAWDGGHIHTAEAVADVAPTCAAPGMTGQTYCDVCKSIVDWGTEVPATGHSYDFDADGVLKCTVCGDLFNGAYTDGKTYADGVALTGWIEDSYYVDGVALTGVQKVDDVYYDFGADGVSKGVYTGLVEIDGKWYYSKLGALASGWTQIDDEWYYFKNSDKSAATGTYTVSGIAYEFEVTGRLISGVWMNDGVGTRYYYGPGYYRLNKTVTNVLWEVIDGNTYGFDNNGYRYEGIKAIRESNATHYDLYVFSDDGVCLGLYEGTETGLVTQGDGTKVYVVEGKPTHAGLVEVDGDYYYIDNTCQPVSGTHYIYWSYANGLVKPGEYEFDADGKLIDPASNIIGYVDPNAPVVVKNGIVDGYYYENNEPIHAGLIEYEGDYYYIKTGGKVGTGTQHIYWSWANGLVTPGDYEFDSDGKMIDPAKYIIGYVDPNAPVVVKNGIVDGYYYENDELIHAGLIEYEGDYYYIKTGGKVGTGTQHIYWSWANGLVNPGDYEFDSNGKMIDPAKYIIGYVDPDAPVVVKEGIVDGYYYENGELVHAGLIKIEGDYYYIQTGGKVATGEHYIYWSWANGLVKPGTYDFGTDGKLVNADQYIIG